MWPVGQVNHRIALGRFPKTDRDSDAVHQEVRVAKIASDRFDQASHTLAVALAVSSLFPSP